MSTPSWWYRDIEVGTAGRDVETVRRMLAAPPSYTYDEDDAVEIRGLQALAGLPATGIVDAATAEVLGERVDVDLTPTWFTRDLQVGDTGGDVARARELLELPPDTHYDLDADAAVRRYRSARGLPLNGVLDATVATLLGE